MGALKEKGGGQNSRRKVSAEEGRVRPDRVGGWDSSWCGGEPWEGRSPGGTWPKHVLQSLWLLEVSRSRRKSGSGGPVWKPLGCPRCEMRGEKRAGWGGILEASLTRMDLDRA